MTAVLSVCLLFATPVAPTPSSVGVEEFSQPTLALAPARLDFYRIWKDEGSWVRTSLPIALVAEPAVATSLSLPVSSSVPIASPAPIESTPPPPDVATPALAPPPIELTLRERALNRLAELGASPWQIATFDCIGFRESGWRNVRSRTGDDGTLQINDIHDPELWRRGLDPYVPEDAATYAWSLSREGTNFRPWSVHALCGV